MGAFEDKQSAIVRQPVTLLRMTVDKCTRTFGSSPCTASAATGYECYNTYKTCQDKTNFNRGTQTLLFCSPGRNLAAMDYWPYLESFSLSPCQIETNKTVRSRLSVVLLDDQDSPDVGMDPYWETRPVKNTGSFFKKLWQRQGMALRGRYVEILEGYVGLTVADFQTRFVGVADARPRFDTKKRFIFECVDLLGDLLNVKVPEVTNSKIAAAITAGSSSITLTSTTSFSSPSGYMRIGDELIRYTSINTTTGVISGLTRGDQGTVAAAHDAGAQAQWVKYYSGNAFDLMVSILEDDAGYAPAYVDEAAFEYWRDWPGDPTGIEDEFRCFISTPATLNEILFSIADAVDVKLWINEAGQITCRRNMPNEPGRAYDDISDAEGILQGTAKLDLNLKSQYTRVVARWYPGPLAKFNDPDGFIRTSLVVDADAEGPNEGNIVIPLEINIPFIRLGLSADEVIEAYVTSMALRRLFRVREAQPIVEIEVDPKDSSILTGKFIRLSTGQIVNMDGSPIVDGVYQVIEREPMARSVRLKLLQIHRRRYGMWAPDGHPDYADATEDEREYGFWCGPDGSVGDTEKTSYCWF